MLWERPMQVNFVKFGNFVWLRYHGAQSIKVENGPLTWSQLLQVDPGREFTESVTKEMEKHKTAIRSKCPEIHRDQVIVERFNRTLTVHLFGHQYAVQKGPRRCCRSEQWGQLITWLAKNLLLQSKQRLFQRKPPLLIQDLLVWTKKTSFQRECSLSIPARYLSAKDPIYNQRHN